MEYLILTFLLITQVSGTSEQCLHLKAVSCLELLNSFFISNSTLPVPQSLSAERLEIMCGYATERFMECSETDFKGCKEELIVVSISLKNALAFLCSKEGKLGWTGRVRCTVSGRQGAIMNNCLSKYEDLSDIMGVLQNQERYHCRLMRELISCAETALEELCGQETLLWFHRFLLTVLQPRADRKRCKLDGIPMGIVIAILTGIASVGAVMAIIIVYFYNIRLLALRKNNFGDKAIIESAHEVKTEARTEARIGF